MENIEKDEVIEEKPAIRRKVDGTFAKGNSGNPSGRPKNTMKDYMRRKFMLMSDEEKEEFLKKVPALDQIKLAEGNPHQTQDVTSGDEPIHPILVKFLNGDEPND